MAGLARLVAAGVEVTNVNTTVTAETLPLIDASFFAELARLGVRHVNLEPDVLRPVLPDPRELAARVLELRGLANAQGLELLGCWGRAVRALATVREGAALPPPADYALLIVDALGHVVPWEYNGVADLGPVSDLPAVLASDAYRRHAESRSPGTIPECVGCEVEGLCQGNASTTLVYERATGRAGPLRAPLRADSRADPRRDGERHGVRPCRVPARPSRRPACGVAAPRLLDRTSPAAR